MAMTKLNKIVPPKQFIQQGDKVSVQIKEGSTCKGTFLGTDNLFGMSIIIVDTDVCQACIRVDDITVIGKMK